MRQQASFPWGSDISDLQHDTKPRSNFTIRYAVRAINFPKENTIGKKFIFFFFFFYSPPKKGYNQQMNQWLNELSVCPFNYAAKWIMSAGVPFSENRVCLLGVLSDGLELGTTFRRCRQFDGLSDFWHNGFSKRYYWIKILPLPSGRRNIASIRQFWIPSLSSKNS